MNTRDKIFQQIDGSRDWLIDLQSNLTSRPAIAPDAGGQGEYEKVMWLKDYLAQMGFDSIEELDAPDERVPQKIRPTLIATINGEDTSRNIWIIAHTDVVPAGELNLWLSDPFQIKVDGDLIFGRGTEDNQQGLASAVLAAKAIIDNKAVPTYNVKLMFVADEEVGSEYGINYILANNKSLFNKNDLILVPDVGDPIGQEIEVAEKSIMWVTCRIIGKQAHGSKPDIGINAARAAANLIVQVDGLRYKYCASDKVFGVPTSTIEPTKCSNNVSNMNTIPGEQIVGFDCRILPQYDISELLKDFRRICDGIEASFGVKIEMTEQQHVQSAPPTKTTDEVYIRLAQSIEEVTGVKPIPVGIGGGTVAASFRQLGYSVGLWSTLNEKCHSPNECSSISNTLKDAKVFADFMLR